MNDRMTEILLDGNIQGSLRNVHRPNTTGVICACDIYKGCGPSAQNIGLRSPLTTFLESPLLMFSCVKSGITLDLMVVPRQHIWKTRNPLRLLDI